MRNLKSFLLVGVVALSACSMSDLTYESTYNTVDRIRVVEDIQQTKIATETFSVGQMALLSEYYDTHGDGVLDLTVSYDPKDHNKGAAWAARQLTNLKDGLAHHGVKDVQARILPVENSPSTTFVRFASVHLLPPKDCDGQETPGLYTGQEYGRDYKLGCGMKTLFTKQISHKADMKGNDDLNRTRSARITTQLAELNASPDPQEFTSTFSLTQVEEGN